MSAAEFAAAHASWCALAADGPYDGPALDLGTPSATQPRLVHPGWIPFAQDWGGNHLAVGTVPGPAGRAGQVLEFGRDLPDGPIVRAHSILRLFALSAATGTTMSWAIGLKRVILRDITSVDLTGSLSDGASGPVCAPVHRPAYPLLAVVATDAPRGGGCLT